MGYGREDVQQALAIDEPNAIKDAYLIVRENQIMRETRKQPFKYSINSVLTCSISFAGTEPDFAAFPCTVTSYFCTFSCSFHGRHCPAQGPLSE